MAVPFTIQIATSNGAYTDESNIFVEYDSIELNKLYETFIDRIVSFMKEYCDDRIPDNTITSYSDFCSKYSNEHGQVSNAPLFMMHYFLDGVWKTWEPELYASEIYAAYMFFKLI